MQPGQAKGLRKISLESNDFNQCFSLYAEEGYHVEALQLLSPDFMDYLLHTSRTFDIEIRGQYVYLYVDGIIQTKAKLKECYELARQMIDSIESSLKRIQK